MPDAIPGIIQRLSPSQNGVSPSPRAGDAPMPSAQQLEALLTSDGARTSQLPEHRLTQAQVLSAERQIPRQAAAEIEQPEEPDSGLPDLATLQLVHDLATGKRTTLEAPAPEIQADVPATTPTAPVAPPQPQPWETAFQAMQQQQTAMLQAMQQSQQATMQALGQLAQTLSAPRQLSPAEQEQQMLAEMQAHNLNPRDPVHIALYQIARENEQLRQQGTQRVSAVEQNLATFQRQAQMAGMHMAVSQKVSQALDALGRDVPPATLKAITTQAMSLATQGVALDQAIAQAQEGYAPLLEHLPKKGEKPQPKASKLPPEFQQFAGLPAFKGKSAEEIRAWLQSASAVPLNGRTSKRQPAPTLAEMDSMFFSH